jgi:hypothetical protein
MASSTMRRMYAQVHIKSMVDADVFYIKGVHRRCSDRFRWAPELMLIVDLPRLLSSKKLSDGAQSAGSTPAFTLASAKVDSDPGFSSEFRRTILAVSPMWTGTPQSVSGQLGSGRLMARPPSLHGPHGNRKSRASVSLCSVKARAREIKLFHCVSSR